MEWWNLFALVVIAWTVYMIATDPAMLLRVVVLAVLFAGAITLSQCSPDPSITPDAPRHR